MDYPEQKKKKRHGLWKEKSLLDLFNVIFQCDERHKLNELQYYVMETEPPEQIKPNLFAWLIATCGVKNNIFGGICLDPSFSHTLCNGQPCLCSVWMYKCDTAQIGIQVRFSGLSRLSLDPVSLLQQLWHPVPLYFPKPSFPIQILHFISYSLFLFSSKTIPLSWLTDSCVCMHHYLVHRACLLL